MDRIKIYAMFEEMIEEADKKLVEYTNAYPLESVEKADKSMVTGCDQLIDQTLTAIAQQNGFQVVSEEGEHVSNIVKSGNYLTIDPIDGTLGYIEHVQDAMQKNKIDLFNSEDLGRDKDYCLLIGIVENAEPRYGCYYNYVTKERILIDSNDPKSIIWENNIRDEDQGIVAYVDQRPGELLENEILSDKNVRKIVQATVGIKSIYTILKSHESAVTLHRVQSAGMWDILPGAVCASAFGGSIYDDNGDLLEFDNYIILPGRGVTIIKGEYFNWVANRLKEVPNIFKK